MDPLSYPPLYQAKVDSTLSGKHPVTVIVELAGNTSLNDVNFIGIRVIVGK
jgi:hypothetical protein